MGKRRYDPEQVREQVILYLRSGNPKVWETCAKILDMPTSSLKNVMDHQWPDEGENETVDVYDKRIDEVAALLNDGPLTVTQLANAIDIGPATVQALIDGMIERGYDIVTQDRRVILPQKPAPAKVTLDYIWPGGQRVLLGHASDLHFGSTKHQNSALRHFTQTAVDMGVEFILVSGDITAGYKMYAGQEMELYAYGADEQVDAACNGLPQISGLKWILLGGNHDASHYNKGGTNVVRRICDQRSDCTYVGFAQSDVPLAPGTQIRMWHPRGGVPYAVSYRAQKGAEATVREWLHDEQWSEDERASIVVLQWGHLHVKGLFWYGNMALLGPGCFEAQTDYEAERALFPEIGGAVIEYLMTSNGYVSDTRVLSWKKYRYAADDYTPMRHADLLEYEEIEPLFSLKEEKK